MSPMPPDLAARYRLGEVLGRGAFGAVYRAAPVGGGPEVAVKVLEAGYDPERFAREVEALRRLDHPHVLRCLDAGGGWLALELATGTAREVWRDPARCREGWAALVAAARGVAALHDAGVAHRDLKPDNLLRVGSRWVVADLGLAKVADLETLTRTGLVQGTPRYMAPEQARGEKPGPAADAWALGMMAYELLEGRTPWPPGEAPLETMMRVARGERPAWRRAPGALSPAGFSAVQAALDPDPAARPRDLASWAAALAAEAPDLSAPAAREAHDAPTLQGLAPRTLRGGDTTRRPREARGRSLLAVILLALVVAGFFLGDGAPPPAPARPAPTRDPVVALAAEAQRAVDRWLEGNVVDADGRPIGPRPGAVHSLRLLSPRYFTSLGAQVAPLGELEARLRGGMDVAALGPEAREALRELGARFRQLGLPSPVHPMAVVDPAPEGGPGEPPGEDNSRARGLSGYWYDRPLPAARPAWLGAGLAAMRRLEAQARARSQAEEAFREGRLEEDWVEPVHQQLLAQRLQYSLSRHRGLESPLQGLNVSLRQVPEAGEVWDHYRPELEAGEEAAYALLRAANEEPEVASLAVVLLYGAVFDPDDMVLHPARCAGLDFPPVPRTGAGPAAALAARVRRRWTLMAQRELVGVDAPGAVPDEAELAAVAGIAEELLGTEAPAQSVLLATALRLLRELVVWRAETGAPPAGWPARLVSLEARAVEHLDPRLGENLWENQASAARRHRRYNGGLAPELRPWVEGLLALGGRFPQEKMRADLEDVLGG